MNKLLFNLFYGTLCFFILLGCSKDGEVSEKIANYSGSYSGTLKENGSYVGVWTGTVTDNGDITVSALNGHLVVMTGVVSANGSFSVAEDASLGSGTGKGVISDNGNVTGSYDGGLYPGIISGGKGNGGSNYIGTWYDTYDGGGVFKLVNTETSYNIYEIDEISGDYTHLIDNGLYTVDENEISVYPSNGINESGKIYSTGDTLIIALVGLNSSVYKR